MRYFLIAVLLLAIAGSAIAAPFNWTGAAVGGQAVYSGVTTKNTTACFDPNDAGTTITGTLDITNLDVGDVVMFGLIDKRFCDQGGYMLMSGAYAYIHKNSATTIKVGPSDGNQGGAIVSTPGGRSTQVALTNVVPFVLHVQGATTEHGKIIELTCGGVTQSWTYGTVKTQSWPGTEPNWRGYAWDEFVDGAYLAVDLFNDNGGPQSVAFNVNASEPNMLSLDAKPTSLYVKPISIDPDSKVVVDLNVANLAQPVDGLQALVNFDSTHFATPATHGAGAVNVVAGDAPWTELIWNLEKNNPNNTTGDLDMSIGVQLAELPVVTTRDATTAIITLKPISEGTTKLVFRNDISNELGTYLVDMNHALISPLKLNSTNIVIDGTPPTGSIKINADATYTKITAVALTLSASDLLSGVDKMSFSNDGITWSAPEGFSMTKWHILDPVNGEKTVYVKYIDKAGNEAIFSDKIILDTLAPVINIDSHPGDPVLRGVHSIVVSASSVNSPIASAPIVTVSDMAVAAPVDNLNGTWTYYIKVDAWTANDEHTINASVSDMAGNSNSATPESFDVNKNQITGTVTLQDYVGGTRDVAFSIDGTTPFDQTITFDSTGMGYYTLTNVPESFDVSAKTKWNLRKKLSATYAAPEPNHLTVLPNQANDGIAAVPVAGDAPTGWGTSSWKSNSTIGTDKAYSRMYLTPKQLFGRDDVKIGDLKSISYWTKKGANHVVEPADWYFQIYTNPYEGQPIAGKWYGGRFNAEPYYSADLQETPGAWNKWQSETGANQLRFYDSIPNYGSYNDGFLSDLAANAAYKDQVIMKMGLGTSTSMADANFDGKVDGLTIELVSGETATVNFEATDGPALVLPGGDINDSNVVNIQDYSIMKAFWGSETNITADITGNGRVWNEDYATMKLNWFKTGDNL